MGFQVGRISHLEAQDINNELGRKRAGSGAEAFPERGRAVSRELEQEKGSIARWQGSHGVRGLQEDGGDMRRPILYLQCRLPLEI